MRVIRKLLNFTSNKLLATSAALLSMCLLSACLNPPAATSQATVTNAPNVPVVDASVNSQHMPHTPSATTSVAPVAPASPVAYAAPTTAAAQGLLLQAGTFSMRSNADSVASTIRNKLPQFANLVQVNERGSNWRVLIGGFANEQMRSQAAQAIRTVTNYDVVNAAP